MKRFSQLFAIAVLLVLNGLQVLAAEVDASVRDPSTIIKHNGTYWIYGTDTGISQWSSPDMKTWTRRGPVLKALPDWVKTTLPNKKENHAWAPDVKMWGGKFYLYYSYSNFGSNASAIGLATSTTLEPDSWRDEGLVITSVGQNYNAIDPCVFADEKGNPWLAFGSFFSGLKLFRLDAQTGKRLANAPLIDIATRPDNEGNSIEAPTIIFHDGWYYLFVNWDRCCAGPRSSYNVRIGRSKTVEGPYLDKSGKSLRDGGGTLWLNAMFDDESGRPIDDSVGPGHVGILQDGANFYVSTHNEWSRARRGINTLNIQKLTWDSDGWPRAIWDEGPFKIVSHLASHGVLSVTQNPTPNGSVVQTEVFANKAGQMWRLQHHGDGFYAILSSDNRALGVAGDAKTEGAKLDLAPFTKRDGQLWFVQMNEDGTRTFLSKISDRKVALDISNCAQHDGASVGTWTSNGMVCQNWSLRTR